MDALIETCVSRKLESLASNPDADFLDGGVGGEYFTGVSKNFRKQGEEKEN